jgi:hypothetical protein
VIDTALDSNQAADAEVTSDAMDACAANATTMCRKTSEIWRRRLTGTTSASDLRTQVTVVQKNALLLAGMVSQHTTIQDPVIPPLVSMMGATHAMARACSVKPPASGGPASLQLFRRSIQEACRGHAVCVLRDCETLLEMDNGALQALHAPSTILPLTTFENAELDNLAPQVKVVQLLNRCLRSTKLVVNFDYDSPFKMLMNETAAPTTNLLSACMLHTLSRLRHTSFDSNWCPLAHGVFAVSSTTKSVWCAPRNDWRLPFLCCKNDSELRAVTLELFRSLSADKLSRAAKLDTTIASAVASMLREVEAWSCCLTASSARTVMLNHENADHSRLEWVQQIMLTESTHATETDFPGVEALFPLKCFNGLVVILGGGHDPLSILLAANQLVDRLTISGYLYFDTGAVAISMATHQFPSNDSAIKIEVPGPWGQFCQGDIQQLLNDERREQLLQHRPVSIVLSTCDCKEWASINKGSHEATLESIMPFILAERCLIQHNIRLQAPNPTIIAEMGNMPQRLQKQYKRLTNRDVFDFNAQLVSAMNRRRSFSCTILVPRIKSNDKRRQASVDEVLNKYIAMNSQTSLSPEWLPGTRSSSMSSRKARTPRASMPPLQSFVTQPATLALRDTKEGLNLATHRGKRLPHRLGIQATSVLMGYDPNRFTTDAGCVNSLKLQWSLLGNSIQFNVLAHVCSHWIQEMVKWRKQLVKKRKLDL